MKVDLDTVRPSATFKDVKPSRGFLWSGKLYLKFDRLVVVPADEIHDGSTRDIGGFNCVCVETGRPGSFKDDTAVRPINVVVVRDGP